MRGDYESHFEACPHCQSRRRLHRVVDFSLIGLTSVSALLFLLAFGVTYHFAPRHALLLELTALFGFGLCALVWLVLMLATPAPVVMFDAAKQGARLVHDRLPPQVRDRIPEELKARIASQ
jgi:hypothetical protein